VAASCVDVALAARRSSSHGRRPIPQGQWSPPPRDWPVRPAGELQPLGVVIHDLVQGADGLRCRHKLVAEVSIQLLASACDYVNQAVVILDQHVQSPHRGGLAVQFSM
jgi:hypothetical protein